MKILLKREKSFLLNKMEVFAESLFFFSQTFYRNFMRMNANKIIHEFRYKELQTEILKTPRHFKYILFVHSFYYRNYKLIIVGIKIILMVGL